MSFITSALPVVFFTKACVVFFSFACEYALAQKDTLHVGVHHFPPCVIVEDSGIGGFDIELFNKISDAAGFEVSYTNYPDFSELISAIASAEIDAAAAGITLTQSREERFSFSYPYFISGLSLLTFDTLTANPLLILWHYFLTTWRALLALALFLFICSIIIWYAERGHPSFNDHFLRGVGDGIYWTNTTMTTVGYGDKTPHTPMGKVFSIIVMWVGIALVYPFVIAQMNTAIQSAQNNSVEVSDLTAVKVGVKDETTSERYAQSAGAKVVEFSSNDQAITALYNKEIEAVITDVPLAQYLVKKRSKLRSVPVPDQEEFYGFALQQNSPYRERINQALLGLMEDGTYREIYDHYF